MTIKGNTQVTTKGVFLFANAIMSRLGLRVVSVSPCFVVFLKKFRGRGPKENRSLLERGV